MEAMKTRTETTFEEPCGGRHRHRGGHRHHHRGRHGRLFDYGELRLLLLAMIAERPRHGYELIKEIEERFGGSYSPSPGVIYPTLAWLDDMGYATVEAAEGNRKRYRLTPEGGAFLAANRQAAADLQQRGGPRDEEADGWAPVFRAMDSLKAALRQRLRQGPLEPAAAATIAAAIEATAGSIESEAMTAEATAGRREAAEPLPTEAPERTAGSRAEVETEQASRYLQQLCKHFAHRCEVVFDAERGRILLPLGECLLEAGAGRLDLTVLASDAAALPQLQEIVASHLERFAFRETLEIAWVSQ